MNFKEYWDDLMTKKPIKDGQTVKMTKEQFYNMQLRAFKKGAFSILSKAKENQLSPDKELNIRINRMFKEMDEIFKLLFPKKGNS